MPELEVRESTIEYIENIEEESIMDFTKIDKWMGGEKTAAETPEKKEEQAKEVDEEERKKQLIIK